MNDLVHDLRHAARSLLRAPRFTAIATLTLALGIGVNIAVFSILDAVLLRPLPYRDPERLISLWEVMPKGDRFSVAPANLVDYREAASFDALAGVATPGRNLTGAGAAERINANTVTANYLEVLGVRPALGRFFRDEEDRPGNNRVAVISHRLWTSRFGADAAILGRDIQLDGVPHTVLAVLPEGFQPPAQIAGGEPVHVFLPAAYPADLLANRGDHEIQVIGRLKAGVTVEQAQAELDALGARLGRDYPEFKGWRIAIAPLDRDLTRNVRPSLHAMLAAVALILLIACVNVANLLLARGADSRRDIAVRLALGASRWRIARALLAQSLLLSSAACAAGLLFGVWCKEILVRVAPGGIPRLDSVTFDARVTLFAIGLSVATSVVFGLVPAFLSSRPRPTQALKAGERSIAGGGLLRARSVLVTAEIALSLLLLTGGLLLLKSFVALNSVDLGYRPERVLAQTMMLPASRYADNDGRAAFFDQLAARVSALPGVAAVGYANSFPMRGSWGSSVVLDHAPPGARNAAAYQAVSPGYFDTLGIRLLRGRGIAVTDRKSAPPVAVVNQAFASKFFPGQDAIGRQFGRGGPRLTIVGVVSNIRRDGQRDEFAPQVYIPAAQTGSYPVGLSELAVRTDADPAAVAKAIQQEVWALDKDQPVTGARTLAELASRNIARPRMLALLTSLFAGLGVTLAMIGVYGVVSYSVSRRRAEMGVRMALGAKSGDLLGLVLRQAAILAAIGVAIGLPAAFALSRYLRTLLFGIEPTDIATYAAAAATLGAVAIVAAAGPARRAARTNPIEALRYE